MSTSHRDGTLSCPLFHLPEIASPRRVYVCDGEKSAEAVRSCGLVATTFSNGIRTVEKADWTPLAGKEVVIVPNNDESGEQFANDVRHELAKLKLPPTVRILRLPDLPPKGDAADYLETRDSLDFDGLRENFETMADASPLMELSAVADLDGGDDADEEKTPRKSAATKAIELLAAKGCELWHTAAGDAFVSIRREGHIEHWSITSREFRRWLAGEFYKAFGQAINSEASSSASNVIAAKASVDGDEHEVFVRVAKHGGKIYLDLCNPSWQAVEIDADGWRVMDKPPVRFRRFKAMLPLPIPERGGCIDELRQIINVTDSTWPLVVGWLLVCFLFGCKYPLLALFAEQGVGKTTVANFLRSLIDPNIAALRAEPRNTDDLIIAAKNSWVVAFDNLSSIQTWLSDALCRLATGGGVSKRSLYTDDEETIFSVTRPVMLTSIEDIASRSDLLDRCLVAHLPTIPSEQRKTDEELQATFAEMRPRLIGAILDAVAIGLKRKHEVHLTRLPRMADFAKWVVACEPGLGWEPGTFLAAYDDNRSEANELALESSIVWKPLSELLSDKGEWRGTAGEMKETLERRTNTKAHKGWPSTPKAMGGAVRRIAPNMRELGWTVSFDGREPAGQRRKIIAIEKASPKTCPTSPTHPNAPF